MKTEQKRYWFPAKRLGWGWGMPQTWQGWVVLVLYVIGLATALHEIKGSEHGLMSGLAISALTLAFLLVCWLKGEPPGRGKWH